MSYSIGFTTWELCLWLLFSVPELVFNPKESIHFLDTIHPLDSLVVYQYYPHDWMLTHLYKKIPLIHFLFWSMHNFRKFTTVVKASSRVDKFSKSDIIVSPSILSANFAKLGEQVLFLYLVTITLVSVISVWTPNQISITAWFSLKSPSMQQTELDTL